MHIELYVMQYPSHLPDMRVSKLLIKPQLEHRQSKTHIESKSYGYPKI